MRILLRSIILMSILSVLLVSEGCSGCAHRHRRANREHIERRESVTSTSDGARHVGRKKRSQRNLDDYTESTKSPSEILTIVESEDYDAMLDAMFGQLNELKSLKKEYFRGSLSDKEVGLRIEEIQQRYHPLRDALEKASSEGKLNYKLHKKQLKLFGEYIKELEDIGQRIGRDMESLLYH